MALEHDEAHALAVALDNVSQYYPNLVPSGKIAAVAGLVITAGRVYGKRAVMILAPAPPAPQAPAPPRPQGNGGAAQAQAPVQPWFVETGAQVGDAPS